MYSNRPYTRQPTGFGGGGGAPPRDILVLLGVLFVTFSLQFFQSLAWLPGLMALSPAAWQSGFMWQLGTYAFVGQASSGIWFLLTLLILFWFGRDVFRALGQRTFWRLIAWGVLSASVSAVVVQILMSLTGFAAGPNDFVLMQGDRILLTVLIAAFATLYGNATIYFFFVLPIQARWFLWLEVLIAFMGFLPTKDLAGFVGICVAVFITSSRLRVGGPRRVLREWRLRLEKLYLEARLRHRRSKSGLRVVPRDDGGPWVN